MNRWLGLGREWNDNEIEAMYGSPVRSFLVTGIASHQHGLKPMTLRFENVPAKTTEGARLIVLAWIQGVHPSFYPDIQEQL